MCKKHKLLTLSGLQLGVTFGCLFLTRPLRMLQFSLSELVRLLVFENEEDVREFCSYYSLRTEGSDLILDRSTYVEPESSIPMWRACGLVESKCMVSVGEVRCWRDLKVKVRDPDYTCRWIGPFHCYVNVSLFMLRHSWRWNCDWGRNWSCLPWIGQWCLVRWSVVFNYVGQVISSV